MAGAETENQVIDQRTKISVGVTIADTDAPTVTELNAFVDIHPQISSGFDPKPDTKEYDGKSWGTGGQDVMVQSDQINFSTMNLVMKTMVTDPDSIRAAFADAEYMIWRQAPAKHQSEDYAEDDLVTIMPLELGLDIDLPEIEGISMYGRKCGYGGNGKNRRAVVAAA